MRRKKRDSLTPEKIIRELAAIGFAKATDYMHIEEGKLTVKPTSELSEAQAAAILSVENGTGGLKMKLYDKMKALELLGKAMGLFDGTACQTQPDNNLLQAILEQTREEVNVDDIHELQQAPGISRHVVEPTEASGP